MSSTWQLFVHGSAPGPFNMGVDEVLLASAIETGRASLRFYGWQGPWLSLGYGQSFDDERRAALERAGVGWVRRVTGGRAVLHGRDLTYSIAAPESALAPGLRASYGVVADALLAALASLGVSATRSPAASRAPASSVFDCFERPAADEICLGGRKLSGSAQRRVGGALLQHGSIRLGPDPAAAVAAVAPGSAGLGGTSLAEEGFSISRRDLEAACIRSFERWLGARLETCALDPEQLARARSRGAEPRSPARV